MDKTAVLCVRTDLGAAQELGGGMHCGGSAAGSGSAIRYSPQIRPSSGLVDASESVPVGSRMPACLGGGEFVAEICLLSAFQALGLVARRLPEAGPECEPVQKEAPGLAPEALMLG